MTQHSHVPAHHRTWHRVIGIDLGTTTCAVAVSGRSGVVVLPQVRAVVGQNRAGQVTVGRADGGDAERVVGGAKRELGRGGRMWFRGRDYQPPELCAFLLIELKRRAEALIGEPVHDAVITVPTSYGEAQRKAITEAAGLAQLNARRLVDDPVAAALAVGAGARGHRTYAIYDLGGGTFDAAIVAVDDGKVTVLAGAGDPCLGGDDFDERIVEYALRQIRERYHVNLSQDQHIRGRIRREAELRKRELTTTDSTTLELPVLTATVNASVPLARRMFETMIESDLHRTLDCLASALTSAFGSDRAAVDGVLLVGGATRIPLVRQRLAERFGLDPGQLGAGLDPEELVARGAGLAAAECPESLVFEGNGIGVRNANLRLRAEMAAPQPEGGAAAPDPVAAAGPAGALPVPPAETPADFRGAAQASFRLLGEAASEAHAELRAAYLAFISAIRAAASDDHLRELGTILARQLHAAG